MAVDLLIKPTLSTTSIDISNFNKCIDDVKNAALDNTLGPDDPTDYNDLLSRLQNCKSKLPPLYIESVYEPFYKTLKELGEINFNKIIDSDRSKENVGGLMLDIAHSILQNGERYCEKATDAFQEVVSDLYDGFLSAEDRENVKKPDKSVIPPLVKWGNPSFGPYTWPVDATENFGLKTGVVNLPPSHARCGLLGWSALGHETGGHDILHADTGLLSELQNAIFSSLNNTVTRKLAEYWANRIDETASDVIGILNMGPAAAIGLIGYFRGLNYAFLGKPQLRNEGSANDPHPADILRGYLATEATKLLKFNSSNLWANVIENETDKDRTSIILEEERFDNNSIRESCKIIANTIMYKKLRSLENHSLGEIQNWYDRDEDIVTKLRLQLRTTSPSPEINDSNIYATHVVAAAVIEAISKDGDISSNFTQMLNVLKNMHDSNPSWGPLYIAHRKDINMRKVYFNINNI